MRLGWAIGGPQSRAGSLGIELIEIAQALSFEQLFHPWLVDIGGHVFILLNGFF